MSDSSINLKTYRAAVRAKWLPLVGRSQLTSHEFELVQRWHEASIPLGVVLKAIDQVKERGVVAYSLGVIRADVKTLLRLSAKTSIGAAMTTTRDDWREKWDWVLQEIVADCTNPELSAMYEELRLALSTLNLAQAQKRFTEIQLASKRV